MDCEQYRLLLSGRIDGENTPEEEQQLQAHLAQCPRCRAVLEDYGHIDQGIHDLSVEPPEGLARGVMAQVNPPAKKRRFIFGGGTLAAAAVIAVVLIGAGSFGRKAEAPAEQTVIQRSVTMEESAGYKLRSADAQFAAADEPLVVEIIDNPESPAAEHIAPLADLPSVLVDGIVEYYVNILSARDIVSASDGYRVSAPDELDTAPDDTPCIVRIIEK